MYKYSFLQPCLRLFVFWSFVLLLVATVNPANAVHAATVNGIAAVVNGEIVTLYEVDKKVEPVLRRLEAQLGEQEALEKRQQLREQAVDRIVKEKLLDQEATRYNITVSDAKLQNQINMVKSRHGLDDAGLEEQLRLQKISRKEYEDQLRREIRQHDLLNAMVRRKVVVTVDEIREYYDAHAQEYASGRSVELALILVDDEATAAEITAMLERSELTFEAAAAKFSKGPEANEGGHIGQFNWSELSPDWREALKGVSEGGVSAPFSLGGDTALVLLEKDNKGTVVPLEEVQESIREILAKPKYDALFKEYIDKLMKKAIVEIKIQ